MIGLKDIHPLSDFVRNTKAHIANLKKSGRAEVLTVNGEAEVVLLSADAYQKLMEELQTAHLVGTANGMALESLRAGKIAPDALIRELRPQPQNLGVPAKQAFDELDRKFYARRKKKAS